MAQLGFDQNLYKSLHKLPPQVLKQVFAFVTKFHKDSTLASINMEKVDGVLDSKVRSARIGIGYRAILVAPEEGETYVLVWAGRHDEAYKWCANKRFEVHLATKHFQVYDLEEARQAALERKQDTEDDEDTEPTDYPLSRLSNEELFQAGVPEELIPIVRAVDSDEGLEALSKALPPETAQILSGIASGMPLMEALQEVLESPPTSQGGQTKDGTPTPPGQARNISLFDSQHPQKMLDYERVREIVQAELRSLRTTPGAHARKATNGTRLNGSAPTHDNNRADPGHAPRLILIVPALVGVVGLLSALAFQWSWRNDPIPIKSGDATPDTPVAHKPDTPPGPAPLDPFDRQVLSQAVVMFERQAETGDPEAQNSVGEMYARGLGVPKDPEKALQWFRKSAEQGNARAQANLGAMHEKGLGVPQDKAESVKWFEKAAAQGHPGAQYHLGEILMGGLGVRRDPKTAVQWFLKAAEKGHSRAQNNLGILYSEGRGVDADPEQAMTWFLKAAEQHNAMAQFNLGREYARKKDMAQAVPWYRKAAMQGNLEAQLTLAHLFATGDGVEQDPTQAAEWYRKAAEQGHAEAQNALGVLLAKGNGVPKNADEAIHWFRQAAAQHHTEAIKNLALMYVGGWGVP
jgi:TPR repeat protein